MGNTSSYPKPSKSIGQPMNNLEEIDLSDELWLEYIQKYFMFVWCDPSIGTAEKVSDTQYTIRNLADIVNKTGQLVHTFDEINACREFLSEVNNVFLITSGAIGEQLVPLVHNLDQIHSIYVFCYDIAKHQKWAKRYSKVRAVCADITQICDSVKSYILSHSLIDYDRIEFDLINNMINSPTIDKHELCLTYSRLTRLILLNINSTDHGKQDMINYCKSEYNNAHQVLLIDDLEKHYSRHDPIWWYTRNLFLQGIVNRALRTRDLYVLTSMHRFIKDLDYQIRQLHDNDRDSCGSFDLYFAQVLSKSDFQRLDNNHGGLICINQFLSANTERGIALMFLKQSSSNPINKTDIRILFQIHIDPTIPSDVIYASIGQTSQFVHENEHLISMFSVFRINKIERLIDIPSGYCVQLILVNRNDVQYQNLLQSIHEEQFERDINLVECGRLIKDRLHIFKSSNKLFRQVLLKQKQDFRMILLHYNMAIIYDTLTDYDKSMREYHTVLEIVREVIPSCQQKNDVCLVPVFANMALTYQKEQKNFSNAIVSAFRALRIVSEEQMAISLRRELESSCYYCLGLIHDHAGKLDEARNFYENALRIRQDYLPLGHNDLTDLQRRITLLSYDRRSSK